MTDKDMLWRAMLADPFDETLRIAWSEYLQEHEPTHTADWLATCPFVPRGIRPTPAQMRLLDCHAVRAGFVGDGAGYGKTTALLLDALRYVEYPGYHAVVLTTNLHAASRSGEMYQWYSHWTANRGVSQLTREGVFRFPTGATIQLRHLSNFSPQGRQYGYIGIDNADEGRLYTISAICAASPRSAPSRPQVPFRFRLTGAHQFHFPVGTTVIEPRPGDNPHRPDASV